ncbi:MAG: sigma 54-interacting transcriptional regulator [bacterium]
MSFNKQDILSFLIRVGLFRDLSEEIVKKWAEGSEIIRCPKGSFLLRQGEIGRSFYIIRTGCVEGAYWDTYQLKTRIFLFKDMDFFGEISLLTNEPSQIGYQAIEDSEIICLPKHSFLEILARNPSFGDLFFPKMTDRQAKLTVKLLEIRNRQISLDEIKKAIEKEASFLVGSTDVMKSLWQNLPELSADSAPVLIIGEFGTGKELIAEIIHSKGPMRNRPFIILDASEITQEDWQERFWEEDPSQTRISNTRFGFLELANGGTLLLKNIDVLSPVLQKRLKDFLCAVEGSAGKGRASMNRDDMELPQVKMIFTSHAGLEEKVSEGQLSPKLYEIISRKVVCMPPLRERKRDILDLAMHFMERHSKRFKKHVTSLSSRAKEQLLGYDYRRGNIQELEEIIERGVVLASSDTIRSEQLFLGPPAGRAHTWFNLINIKPFRTLVRKGLYPGIFRWIAVAFFFFIMFFCFFGTQDPEKNWGTILVWWIWWPWLCAAAFWIGRTWCSFCAYATLGNALQRRLQLNLSFPKYLKNYDYIVTTLLFLFVVWVEEATHMRYHPFYTGMLLASILLMELLFSLFFPRDTWCRYVCPMGNLIGVFAMTSIVEVRSNPDICVNECSTHDCYHGREDQPGCPMFQHLVFVDNNQTCKLCLNCIRACPHQAVSLNLRAPGWEIWASNQVRPGMVVLVCALMGVLFPVIRPFRSLWLTSLAFLATPLLIIGLIWGISFLACHSKKESVYECFWKAGYAYVPIALAAHIAYQLQNIPWFKDIEYAIFMNGRALMGINSSVNLIQGLILFLGILFSLYAIIRITRDKFHPEIKPGLFFWLGHSGLMILYPFLIWYFLR